MSRRACSLAAIHALSLARRVPALSLVLLLLAATGAPAQQAVSLAFKYAPGDVLDYDVTLTGSGGLRAPDGQFSPAGIQGNLRLSMTVAEVRPDGNARIQLRIPRADFQMSIAQERASFTFENGKVRWFANGREQSPPDADLSQAPLISVPLEFIAAPTGRIVEVIPPNVPGLANMQQMVPGLGPPQTQNLGDPLFPESPVRVGETWRKSSQLLPLGPTLPFTITSSRTLDSLSNEAGLQMARISGYAEARFRAGSLPLPLGIGAGEAGGMTIGVPDLRHTMTSTEFFNVGAGKLIRGDYDFSFMTRVSVGMQGQNQEASLEARLHATMQAR
jgi:hypothetical protein